MRRVGQFDDVGGGNSGLKCIDLSHLCRFHGVTVVGMRKRDRPVPNGPSAS